MSVYDRLLVVEARRLARRHGHDLDEVRISDDELQESLLVCRGCLASAVICVTAAGEPVHVSSEALLDLDCRFAGMGEWT